MMISVTYTTVIYWTLRYQAKNVDLAKMRVTVNCSSSPNWMVSVAVWVNTEVQINIMLTSVLFWKHSISDICKRKLFQGRDHGYIPQHSAWSLIVAQEICGEYINAQRLLWVAKIRTVFAIILDLAWDSYTLEQFLLFSASNIFFVYEEQAYLHTGTAVLGKGARQTSTVFFRRPAIPLSNGECCFIRRFKFSWGGGERFSLFLFFPVEMNTSRTKEWIGQVWLNLMAFYCSAGVRVVTTSSPCAVAVPAHKTASIFSFLSTCMSHSLSGHCKYAFN